MPRRPKISVIRKSVLAKRGKTLAAQKEKRKIQRRYDKAKEAVTKFKTRKKDRGNIVFISTKGKPGAEQKGRKGYLVYVTKTGKKQLVNDESGKNVFLAKRVSEIEIPIRRNLRKATSRFRATRLLLLGEGIGVVRASGNIKRGASKNTWGFGDSSKLVSKLTNSLGKAFKQQNSNRDFLVKVAALIKTASGNQTVFAEVPIVRRDHIAIKYAGLEHFVRRQVYAFLAKELAYLGYVLAGSANHIRRLEDNEGLDESEWVDSRGESWGGIGLERVSIENFSWEIYQQK